MSQTSEKAGITGEIKCDHCDFVAKNKFGLKIHIHKKHSTARFNCFTCDFQCETHSDLVEHNDNYYYSHRITLNREYGVVNAFKKSVVNCQNMLFLLF